MRLLCGQCIRQKERLTCLYDTLEEFMRAWEEEEWEAQGTFCLTLEQVEVLKVLQEEHTEEN